jgi:hypothetical protein
MKKMNKFAAACLVLLIASLAAAQPDGDQVLTDEKDPNLVHSQWVDQVRLPDKIDGPYVALSIPPAIFGKAQDDLRDLRLTDAKGNRVPFVLRTLRPEYRQNELRIATQIDDGPSAATKSYQVRIELAEVPAPGHNEIEIDTPGSNFHRKVEVFGDDSQKFADPRPLFDKDKYLLHFESEGRTVDVRRFHYDIKQFRFLRLRVYADPNDDKEIPKITRVSVRHTLAIPGKLVTERANFGGTQGVRGDGGPGTAWLIQLPDKMPCEMLTFELTAPPTERPFRLQVADPDQPSRDILSSFGKGEGSEWRVVAKGNLNYLEVRFPEVVARRLRFVLTDFANPPLQFQNVQVTRSDRQLIFEKPDDKKFTLPLRLYSGNPNVGPANYVLGQKVPAELKPAPPLADLFDGQGNPSYEPPPEPLDKRMPWLVYVALGIACAVLAVILGLLAFQAIRRHDQTQTPTSNAVA